MINTLSGGEFSGDRFIEELKIAKIKSRQLDFARKICDEAQVRPLLRNPVREFGRFGPRYFVCQAGPMAEYIAGVQINEAELFAVHAQSSFDHRTEGKPRLNASADSVRRLLLRGPHFDEVGDDDPDQHDDENSDPCPHMASAK